MMESGANIGGLVSVIMPVYNGEAFIAEAIESVLNQTYDDWELIVVNDGSIDGTARILTSLTDSRMRVFHQLNGGEASARNAGLDAATGEYIAFLDADDVLLPDALTTLIGCLSCRQSIGAVYSDGYICERDLTPLLRFSEIRPVVDGVDLLESLVLANVVVTPDCTVVRRSEIERLDLRFDCMLRYGVDWDFWTRLAVSVEFAYANNVTCLYRIHGDNMTSTATIRQRRRDLVPGRLKVMNAAWFSGLSESTRFEFFFNLLIGLLGEDIGRQRMVMEGLAFQALSPRVQSKLLRMIASSHMMRGQEAEFAVQCLRRSLVESQGDSKARMLLWACQCSPRISVPFLRGWRLMHSAKKRFWLRGGRRPARVPQSLRPVAD